MGSVDGVLSNGTTEYGSKLLEKVIEEEKAEAGTIEKLSNLERLVLSTFRLLVADLCQQFKGGHPG